LLVPLIALALILLNAHISPFDFDRTALPFEMPFALVAVVIWYLSFPLYVIAHAFQKCRPALLESLSNVELRLRVRDATSRLRWDQPFRAREGRRYFLFESDTAYIPIPKRTLPSDKLSLLKSKVGARPTTVTAS